MNDNPSEQPSDNLTDWEEGFNAGLHAASNYHEIKAEAYDKGSQFFRGMGDGIFDKEVDLQATRMMMFHREHRNAIWRLRIQTAAEKKRDAAYADFMTR